MCAIAFFLLKIKHFLLKSIPVPRKFSLSFKIDTIIQPEPTPISKILILYLCLLNFNTFSTTNSVSGLGINVSFVIKNSEFQKDFFLVKYANGFREDLCSINL